MGRSPKRGEGGSPTLSPGTDAGRVCPKDLHDAEPTKHTQPFPWKGVFGKDAEIRTRRALHEAKPSECPKGIGIINQKFSSKTDFFSKLNLYISVCRKNNIFLKWGLGRSPKAGRRDASPRIHPLSGERGQGDRDNKSEVYFKNRLFLQADTIFNYRLQ